MNREIKFRAWDKEFSVMRDMHDLTFIRIEDYSSLLIEIINGFDGKDTSFHLMQYTGLKDRNGVEIYEGDILKGYSADDNAEFTTKVRWVPSCFIVDVVGQDFDLCGIGAAINELCHEYEAIGNIHESPDLLK